MIIVHSQNWRAFVTLVICVAPAMPGLIHSINPSLNVGGIYHLFAIGWIFGVRAHFIYLYDKLSLTPFIVLVSIHRVLRPLDFIPGSGHLCREGCFTR